MPNGDGEGAARAERLRAKYEQNRRARENALREDDRELPPYRDEMDSEVTVNTKGIAAKLGLPRWARMAIGFGLGFLFVCIGVAIVLRSWPR